MLYRLPESGDRDTLAAYVQEHHDCGESSISASLGLSSSEYNEWVDTIHRSATEGQPPWGKSTLFLCFDGNRLIGLVSIRYELPADLSNQIGDIGYGVRPSERQKSYATEMLGYALSMCRQIGLNQVILGCYKDNIASAATIRKNGGILVAENDNYRAGRISQYYRIKLAV